MGQLIFNPKFVAKTATIDAQIAALQNEKIRLLLRQIIDDFTPELADMLLGCDKIVIGTSDRGICIQLNRYCAEINKIQFVIDKTAAGFLIKIPKEAV